MHINLNRSSNISLSRQIYQYIADRIASGLLEKGSRLLSIKNLSKILKVSLVTVFKSYSMLEKDNLIVTIQGKCTYVQSKAKDNKKISNDYSTFFDWQLSITDNLP